MERKIPPTPTSPTPTPPPSKTDWQHPKRQFESYKSQCKKSTRNYFIKHWSGDLKVACVILLLVSYSLMRVTKTANVFIPVILILESSFFFFFIFANILALPKYLKKLTWPVFDVLNDVFAFLYLSYAGFYSLIYPPSSIDALYWQICVVILFVALLSLIDIVLQSWRFSFRKIKFGIQKPIKK